MKIKPISKICQKNKEIFSFSQGGSLWLGNCFAIYSIPELVDLPSQMVCPLLEIESAEKPLYSIFDELPLDINLSDTTADEILLTPYPFMFAHDGQTFLPLYAEIGKTLFVNTTYLKPLNSKVHYDMYLRSDDAVYIKEGVFLRAVVMPCKLPLRGLFEQMSSTMEVPGNES